MLVLNLETGAYLRDIIEAFEFEELNNADCIGMDWILGKAGIVKERNIAQRRCKWPREGKLR